MNNILFLDIETVPLQPKIDELSENLQKYWCEKAEKLGYNSEETSDDDFFRQRAGIYAEFGKIICISVGIVYKNNDNEDCLKIKSFANDDETVLLNEFKALVIYFMRTSSHRFCGHNIKEFDIPYIGRRMIINGIQLPPQLQLQNKKPWELPLLDTMSFWKFGDYKNYTSLKLLAEILGVSTPKDDIDGSMVADVYYNENNLQRIATYCQKDVVATVQVWLKLNGNKLIKEQNIEMI